MSETKVEIEISDIDKLTRAIQYCFTHFQRRDEANSAIHMNDKVIYSSITNECERALLRLQKLRSQDPL